MLRHLLKTVAILGLLALVLLLPSCSNNNSTATDTAASGTWQAVLAGGAGPASTLDFVTAFTVNGDTSLSITAFSFLNTGTCFVSGETQSGTATLTVNGSNQVTGPFTYTIQSGNPAGNVLVLNGTLTGTENGTTGTTLSGATITGTWNLTNGSSVAGCSGVGSFTMTQT